MAKVLIVVGRLVGLAGAALTIALMAWWAYDLSRYAFFSEDPTWAEVGVEPFVIVLRIIVAAWVVWSVVRFDGGVLLSALLLAFGASFSLLLGWYFLLTGMDWSFYYWVVGGDFLYLIAVLMMGCALQLSESDDQPGTAQR
jgi:hypothetical protein